MTANPLSNTRSETGAGARHELPTHLHVEDRLIAGLTVRQTLMLSAGVSLSYSLWQQLAGLQLGIQATLGQVAGQQASHVAGVAALLSVLIRVAFAALPLGAFALVALARPADRPLEEWLVIALRYATLPKTLVWRSDGADSTEWNASSQGSVSPNGRRVALLAHELDDPDDVDDLDDDEERETDFHPIRSDVPHSRFGQEHEKGHRRP